HPSSGSLGQRDWPGLLLETGCYAAVSIRCAADTDLPCNLRRSYTSRLELTDLLSVHPCCRDSAFVLSLCLSLGDANKHSFPDQLPLKLSNGAEHVEHQSSCGRRGV